MKYTLPDKYQDTEQQCIQAVARLLPALEALADEHHKELHYVASMVLRAITTKALRYQDAQIKALTGETVRDRGRYHIHLTMWCNDDFIDSNIGNADADTDEKGPIMDGLIPCADATLDFAEQFIREDEDWPFELDEDVVERRISTQRGNLYGNKTQSTVVNFPFVHRSQQWLMQVRLTRAVVEVRKEKKESLRDKLKRKGTKRK